MRQSHLELAHLELLLRHPSDRMAGQAELQDSEEHLQECSECTGLAEVYSFLLQKRFPIDIPSPTDCPTEETWFEVAGGLLPEEKSTRLLAHAMHCDHCGKRLRAAIEDVGPSMLDEELDALKSSNRTWQKNLADRLASINRAEEPIKATPIDHFRWQWMFPVAIAALLLIAVAIFGWRRYKLSSDDALLASSFDKQRLTELRLYGGHPVPRASQTRGVSGIAVPIDLLKLKLRAEEHLETNPNDAYWQQMLGRVALLEGDGEEAHRKLEVAFALNASLPGLQFDQAAAYFEMGEATGHDPTLYAKAAHFFGKVIDDPSEMKQRPLAYSNRALSWERQSVYCEAVQDYQNALNLEKDPSWRREIQRHLEKVTPKCQKSEGREFLQLDRSPTAFLRVEHNDPERARADYEIYLDTASREWLVAHTPEAEAALRKLAAIGLAHNDRWLRDLLRSPSSDLSRQGTESLAKGLQASALGHEDNAFAAITEADRLYRKSRNEAGALRARVEMVYILQRMARSKDCLTFAAPLEQNAQLHRDSWLYSYLVLEIAICRAADRGDWVNYAKGIRKSIELSTLNGFPLQVLREKGLLVEALSTLGQPKEAWMLASNGLEECIRANCPPARAYQFLQSLHSVILTQDLDSATADVADAAADASSMLANAQLRAYAQEVLGAAETTVGHTASAKEAFTRASAILRSMPPGKTTRLYGADWQADRSLLLEREGQTSTALSHLEQVESEITATGNYNVRQRHYTELASLLLHANKPAEALNKVLFAVRDAEGSLSATSDETQRLSWDRINRRGYILLVQSLVEMGKPQEALSAWEWYRSAPYRTAANIKDFQHSTLGLPSFPNLQIDQRHNLILVVARLEDFYVVWSISNFNDKATRMVKVSTTPSRIADMAHTFTELCSNRDSEESDIRVLGQHLYDNLFAPFDSQIQSTSLLLIDLDSSLQRLPFAALTPTGHRYLNDTHALIFLPRWWVLRPLAPDTVPMKSSVLVVEGAPSVPGSGAVGSSAAGSSAPLSEEYLESNEIAARFSRGRLIKSDQSSTALLLRLLPQADVFHFSGHTLSLGEQTGLLLKYPDALLTASSLSGILLRHSRLAVLATCSSAGKTEYGMDDTANLAHALLAAGTSNVVATLWDVDSRASRTMMLQFYESISHASSVSAAVRAAQQTLRSDSSTNHPFFWSSMQVFSH